MSFDYELQLLSTSPGENDMGDPIEIPVERTVLCDVRSITRSEHYQAAASGLKPSIVFVVNKYEYQAEQNVEYEGKQYRVMRTYLPKEAKGLDDFETIELVCEGLVDHARATERYEDQ